MGAYQELKDRFFYKAVLAELFATAFFVFTITLVLVETQGFGAPPLIVIAFAIGLSLAVIIHIFGPICGSHLNPAVTIAFLIKGEISFLKSSIYIVVQVIGAIMGAAMTYAIVPSHRRGGLGVLTMNSEINEGQGFAMEMLFTILLQLTIFASASSDHDRKDFGFANGLAIGLCLSVSHFIGVPYSGSGLNPARALGPAIVMGDFKPYLWIHLIGPIVGGIVAAISYRFVMSVEKEKELSAEDNVKVVKASTNASLEFNVVTTP